MFLRFQRSVSEACTCSAERLAKNSRMEVFCLYNQKHFVTGLNGLSSWADFQDNEFFVHTDNLK
ncbi:MAG: hypothetical protein C0602_07230 [Denitrovibrio sp.]|nr:MAG: hypothetical protein C0602_07230 [Denitrovibrio sp.]